jgi:hypothetical protein
MAMNAVKQCGFIMIYHPGKLLTPPGRLKTNSREWGSHGGTTHEDVRNVYIYISVVQIYMHMYK